MSWGIGCARKGLFGVYAEVSDTGKILPTILFVAIDSDTSPHPPLVFHPPLGVSIFALDRFPF